MIKKAVTILSSIFIVLAIGLGLYAFKPSTYAPITPTPAEVSKKTESVRLEIDYGDGQLDSFEINHKEGQTAFSILKNHTTDNGLEFSYDEYDFGNLVTSVNGFENSNELVWIYFVNENAGDIASDQKLLQKGDLIEWKYIEPNLNF